MAEVFHETPGDLLRHRPGGKWCILQHAGHLLVLDSLGEVRLDDYLSGKEVLTPADMGNRETETGDYERGDPARILGWFHDTRQALAERLSALTPDQVSRRSFHGRLNMEMRLIDWVCFMCEHDDHHLAVMAAIRAEGLLREPPATPRAG